MRAWCIATLCLIAATGACRSKTSQPALPDDAAIRSDAARAKAEPVDMAVDEVPVVEDFAKNLAAPGVAEKTALRDLGAVPVWDAVIARGDYLARRGKQGMIHGTLGPPVDEPDRAPGHPDGGAPDGGIANDHSGEPPYHWFIDDTEGSGSLAVRLAYDSRLAVKPGDRLLVWGAWHVDTDRRWYWKATRMARLEAQGTAPDQARSAPGHVIVDIAEPPAGAVPVAEAAANPPKKPVYIIFEVRRSVKNPAEGWEISDRTRWKPVARLFLPGERESYGAQDFRSPNEHWTLERETRYVVRVKPFLPPKPGVLTNMTALDAPRRIKIE